MARSRNIKPGFFMNDELGRMNPIARLLFAGLWCVADREGRLLDRPMRIKAEVLPYDDVDIEELLNALHNKKFIIRYSIEEVDYIQIINFSKHQNPHKNEAESTIPPYVEIAPEKHSTSTVQEQEKHITNPADSLNLIPDSLNLIPLNPEPDPLKLFDVFWSKYPKKKSKGQAEKAWAKIKLDEELFEKIIKSVELAKETKEWTKNDGQFIPYPATWLNAKGWEDETNRKEDKYVPYTGEPDDDKWEPYTGN